MQDATTKPEADDFDARLAALNWRVVRLTLGEPVRSMSDAHLPPTAALDDGERREINAPLAR
jgi:hypothetical protein